MPRGPRRETPEPFGLEIPFGGQQVKFWLKSDPESPILRLHLGAQFASRVRHGKLGGCVWRRGCRWHVEQKNGRPILELYMPKQTPEPWSYVVEGYHNLSRTVPWQLENGEAFRGFSSNFGPCFSLKTWT